MLAELMTELRPHLLAVLIAVSIALLGLLANAVRVLQSRAVVWLEGFSADARWKAAIARLDAAATAAVDDVEQRLGSDLRAAEPNPGHLTAEQAATMARAAFDSARAHFGPATWDAIAADLEVSIGDIPGLLRTRIEAALRRRKIETPSAGLLLTGESVSGEIVTLGDGQ